MSSTLSYALLTALSTMVIMNDVRKRFFEKEAIRYRIREEKKYKYVGYGLGLLIPIIIMISGIILEDDPLTLGLMIIMSIEMGGIWTIIQLGDTLITKDVIGKGWFTRLVTVVYFDIQYYKERPYLVFQKAKSRKREMVWLRLEDVEPVRELLGKIHFSVK